MRTDTRNHDRAIAAAEALGPAYSAIAAASRTDPALFCQFVLKDDADGSPIELAPMHEEWHDILSSHQRAVLWTHTEAGKTTLISVGRVLWEIGRNPNIRILILSASASLAKRIVKSIKNYIENSVEYRMVFPHVVPDKSDTTGAWRDDSFIVRRRAMPRDPTVQATGFGGNILGGRYDLVVIDDYLTAENTYSDHNRLKYYGWLKSTIESRRTADASLWFIGNAWHLEDAMHRYAGEPRTFSKKWPVVIDGVSSWPTVWPADRIQREIEIRGPIESRRSLFCDPVSDADRRFKLAYLMSALVNGDGIEEPFSIIVPIGHRVVTGVDVAVTKNNAADEAALTTVVTRERDEVRQVINIEFGRWGGPELVDRIRDANRRYNSHVWVETNGVQRMLKQFLNRDTAVPVKAFNTGRNKYDPAFGIESLAIEFSAGKWIVPNRGGSARGIHADMSPGCRKLVSQMLSYDPASHTGDVLMSAWIAREGSRLSMAPAGATKRARRT